MSDNDQVSEDVVDDDAVDETNDSATDDNSKDSDVNSNDDNSSDVTGNTNDSITASLEEIKSVDVLKSMVTRLRHENGNHRKRNKEQEKQIESLKTEKVQRSKSVKDATERAERAEAKAHSYVVKAAALEYDVDEDLMDLIEGNTEEEVWAKAEKLANTKKRKPSYELPDTFDPFAKRTKAVDKQRKDQGAEYIRDLFS